MTDRLLRILAAVVIALLYITGYVSGPAAVVLGISCVMSDDAGGVSLKAVPGALHSERGRSSAPRRIP